MERILKEATKETVLTAEQAAEAVRRACDYAGADYSALRLVDRNNEAAAFAETKGLGGLFAVAALPPFRFGDGSVRTVCVQLTRGRKTLKLHVNLRYDYISSVGGNW